MNECMRYTAHVMYVIDARSVTLQRHHFIDHHHHAIIISCLIMYMLDKATNLYTA